MPLPRCLNSWDCINDLISYTSIYNDLIASLSLQIGTGADYAIKRNLHHEVSPLHNPLTFLAIALDASPRHHSGLEDMTEEASERSF